MLDQRLRQPGGELAERIARRVPDASQLQRFVAPDRLDEACAGAIGALRDVPDQGGRVERRAAVGERANDHEALPGLQVERHLDRELAVAL